MKEGSFSKPSNIEQEPTADERKDVLLAENAEILSDSVFKKIIASLDDGWDTLSDKKKQSVIKYLEDLLGSLKEYHDSYVGLKAAAKQDRLLYTDDIDKYRAAVEAADAREHALHNTFIDCVNILSRTMKNAGLSNEWRGDDEIFALDKWGTRQKLKHWMFKIFGERIK